MLPVTVIGSCRVYEPLLRSSITLDQSCVYGYTHNTREHFQMLNLVGRTTPGDALISELTSIPVNFTPVARSTLENRIFVVEISSIRILEYRGWFLQMNRFAALCEKLLGQKYRPDQFGSERSLKAVLATFDQKPLELDALRYYEQSETELCHGILQLDRVLDRRALFVCHFNSDRHGSPIWQRARIQSCLDRLHRRLGLNFFDPTPHVIRRSPARALKDLGHYTPEFEREMTDLLFEKVQRLESQTH